MSTTHSDTHQRATAELRDGAAHTHRAGEQHGKQDHPDAHEQSRRALEHSGITHHDSHAQTAGHGIATFGHQEIEALAHELWQARGCPEGTSQEDWFRAAEQLRSHAGKLASGAA